MSPHRFAQALSLLGVAAFAVGYFLRPSPPLVGLGLGVMLGAAILQYPPGQRPFVLPLYAWVSGLLALTQLFVGHFLGYVGGLALGLALPYLLYLRQRSTT